MVVLTASLIVFASMWWLPPAQDLGDRAYRWAMQRYDDVLERVLPIDRSREGKLAPDLEWSVALRILPPAGAELICELNRTYDGELRAPVTSLTGGLLAQLQSLYQRNHEQTIEAVSLLIARKTYTLTQDRCPDLPEIWREFVKLQIPAALPDSLQMDVTRYDLISRSAGRTLRLSTAKPDPAAFVEWAERVHRVVIACGPQ